MPIKLTNLQDQVFTIKHPDNAGPLSLESTDIQKKSTLADDFPDTFFEPPCKATLDLDFANQRFEIYDRFGGFVNRPLVDIVRQERNTVGSIVDAIGAITEVGANENRLTFDNETGEALGYLSEESRMNLFTDSDLAYVDGGVNNCTTETVTTINPFYVTADVTQVTITGDQPGGGPHCRFGIPASTSVGDFYTGSIYIRSDDNITVEIDTNDGPIATYQVSSVWRRVYAISGNNTGHEFFDLRAVNGSVGKTFQVACKQLEVGKTPTSYIKSSWVAGLRGADLMSRKLDYEFNPNEGTFVIESYVEHNNQTGRDYLSFYSEFSYVNKINLYVFQGFIGSDVLSNAQLVKSVKTPIGLGRFKVAVSYSKDGLSMSLNGGDVIYSSGDGLPTLENLVIGRDPDSAIINSSIKRLRYYPRSFENSTLSRLSRK